MVRNNEVQIYKKIRCINDFLDVPGWYLELAAFGSGKSTYLFGTKAISNNGFKPGDQISVEHAGEDTSSFSNLKCGVRLLGNKTY